MHAYAILKWRKAIDLKRCHLSTEAIRDKRDDLEVTRVQSV